MDLTLASNENVSQKQEIKSTLIKDLVTLDELVGKDTKYQNKQKKSNKSASRNPNDWGFPGYLTEDEAEVFIKFRDIVNRRGGEFRDTVYSFTNEEGEAYTLTRWLRARKYVYNDVVKMVEEAIVCRSQSKSQNYYPDPVAALGIHPYIYIRQFPQLYVGFAKNGCPIFISKPGMLNIDAVECVTSLDSIINYHWHVMQHDFLKRLLSHKSKNSEFVRFETITILDLDHLKASQLNTRTLGIIKKQSSIDSLCFPETMNKMLIVNAPRFFSLTWKIIKGWLDPRTSGKIEIFSSKVSMKERLLELVDVDQLPEDYGGMAENTTTTIGKNIPNGMIRIATELLTFRTYDSHLFHLNQGEELDIFVHTRGKYGASFSVFDNNKVEIISGIDIIHNGKDNVEHEMPTQVKLNISRIVGPQIMKIKAATISGRKCQSFLLVFYVYPKL